MIFEGPFQLNFSILRALHEQHNQLKHMAQGEYEASTAYHPTSTSSLQTHSISFSPVLLYPET